MGIIAAGQITVVDLSDAPVLNTFITASRPTTQTYSKDSRTYKPSYASTPQVLTLKVTKSGSTANIIDSISSLHWFVVDGPIKTEITSKDNSANEYISGAHNEILTTKLDIDLNKGSKRYEVMGIWPDPSTGLDVQFGGYIDLLLTQNGATGPQGPQGDTGNGIANTVITYGLSMSDTTEPATWSSEMPTLVKGMYLWTRTVIIYTNGSSTTSYQISYIAKDADATAEIDKAKQELLEKLETVRDESLDAVDKAKQDLTNVASELNTAKQELADSVTAVNTKVDNAKAELTQAKQELTTVADDLSQAKTDLQTAVSEVDTKATNLQSDLTQAKQDLASQAQQLQAQANAQSELTKRVSSVEKTANGTKTTVGELSKTVAQNGKDITSVTARTKVVEDDLAGTKTTLSQVQTTANSTSQKTATLETGLNGLSAKFDSLKIGGTNLLLYSADPWQAPSGYYQSSGAVRTDEMLNGSVVYKTRSIWSRLAMNWGKHLIDRPDVKVGDEFTYSVYVRTDQESPIKARLFFRYSGQSSAEDMTGEKTITQEWQRFTKTFTVTQKMLSDSSKLSWVGFEQTSNSEDGKYVYYACNKLERGNIVTDYSPNEADLEQKVAEYKQNADQNYASLQTTVQNLDGTVQHNKTTAEQTAQGFKTRIESLETYKNGESERANAYFESAKTETAKQLTAERTAIANNYVAKSTYTSDVTGIRNDLSATTTTANTIKTNLANYQASNDRAVANLQSNLQTANGNISSLKTKVEAVPGQITSAVSAVEGKIPTSAGGRNLALGTSGDWSGDWTNFNGQNNQTRTIYRIYNRGLKVGDKVNVRLVLKYSDIVAADGQTAKISTQCSGNVTAWGAGGLNGQSVYLSPDGNEVVLSKTTTITDDHLRNDYWNWGLRVDYVASGRIQWKEAKAEAGDLPTPWSPAPEDTAEQISNLSSQIKQTADGITLLATKTELNTAKNELQSGINTATNKANSNAQVISTHTTQISALNTGLQAKVSQTDFNTLSGRVTSAENNITAKANELSSKITSVENKIPTSIGGRNLYALSQNSPLASNNIGNLKQDLKTGEISFKVTGRDPFFGAQAMKDEAVGTNRGVKIPVKTGQDIAVKLTNPLFTKNFVSFWSAEGKAIKNYQGGFHSNVFIVKASELEGVSYVTFRFGIKEETQEVGSVHSTKVKVEYGNVYTDWSPAPEDTTEQISSLSSELKQTKDGITLLATKTELNNAKNELQSGINTATNKANNNAQTISTHTTQISALNTGLQAKVSQSDFNTLSGRVTTAENNITAKANELSSKITSVEGKIPTSIGSTNLLLYSADPWQAPQTGYYQFFGTAKTSETYNGAVVYKTSGAWSRLGINLGKHLVERRLLKVGDVLTYSVLAKTDQKTPIQSRLFVRYDNQSGTENINGKNETINLTNEWKKFSVTFTVTEKMLSEEHRVNYLGWEQTTNSESGKFVYYTCNKIERGNIATDYSPAPEDTIEEISSLTSQIQQTKDGITLLATKTELNNAKNELQSGINTATNKANAAQNTANSAQNKANSNAQTISTHTTQISALNTGLSAKVSQSDFNTLSSRVTTAENNITAKANELSSKITSVEGKLPSGETNLVDYGRPSNGYSPYAGAEYTTHGFYYNGAFKMYIIRNKTTSEKTFGMNRFKVERNTEYTLYFKGFNNWLVSNMDVWFLKRVNGSTKDYDSAQILVSARKLSNGRAEDISVTFNTGDYDEGYLRFDNNGTTTAGTSADLYFGDVSVKKGRSNNGWSPSWSELATSQDLKNAQSEFKQTTDSIKASVTSLDKSTVKSSSLTINSDGIVMKAGKSTTDVANAIGSYFAVNQNAIDLFADKIKVKGNMIVNGTITGDKIKASSVDVSKIVGIDANFIKSKIEHAMIDWLKGKTITAYNDNMTIDLQNGRISFKDGSNAVYRQTSDGIHTGFLHFEAGSQGGVYAAFGTTSTRQGINSKSSEFAGIRCYRVSANGDSHAAKIDKIEVIGDTVQFGHTYYPNGTIGGGFIMNTAAYYDDPPYSLNRMVSSIESLWRILYVHGKNVGYNLSHPNFINALRDEYNAWHDMHNR